MLLTTNQVLKLLNVSKPTLYKLLKQKQITAKKTVGGHRRYSEDDLKRLLNDQNGKSIETKFVDAVNDVWIILKKLSEDIWGIEGQDKLTEILLKNKKEIFILNISKFEGATHV
jgi:excisionase family DNA binding protein